MTHLKNLITHPKATKQDRRHVIGGTDARIIAEGKDWLSLWQQKTGRASAPDLFHAWKPRLGLVTENLHAWWHTHKTGSELLDTPDQPMTRPGIIDYAAATFDRWVIDADIPLELKHTNAANNLRNAAEFYMPQLQWQMFVGGVQSIRFSIICGNEEPVFGIVEWDQAYFDQLLAQVQAFWWHVTEDVAPDDTAVDAGAAAGLVIAAGTVKIDGRKPYDFSTNNEWVSKAAEYIEQKTAADKFETTKKEIRALIPADAEIVTGGGLQMKRDARGAYRATILEQPS